MEFWWHEQNDLKTLECEEVLDIPSLGAGKDVYGCRYAHSIVDLETKRPVHLDGAIRMYDETQMLERIDKNMYTMGRHSVYTKLWRVDGPLPIHLWKELITHHFRDNELPGEYLGGKDESGHVRPTVLDPVGDPLSKFVPCSMSAGAGVRISVAFHHPPEDGPPVEVVPLDTWGPADSRSYYVEADTIEVVKLLRRDGVAVVIPEGTQRLAFDDMVINFSLILHRGAEAPTAAERTQRAMCALCDAWVGRDDNRTVSFSVGVGYPDRTVYFSFAGHVVDLRQFFLAFGTGFPASHVDVGGWAQSALGQLGKLFSSPQDVPRLSHMLLHDGILRFDRKNIDPELFEISRDADGKDIITFKIPPDRRELVDVLSKRRLAYAHVWLLKRSECSACKKDYSDCLCSKYLDGAVTQMMADVEFCGLFWTDRSASEVTLAVVD